MALNKYMHPRNIYKTPPDFLKLSKMYPEFSSIVKMDVTNKVSIDFKDPQSLRILTKCLLKSDFNIEVEIPEDKLVPTLPLRLNYILWIEDLLISIHKKFDIRGLDIGTGACAIYPLLAVTKNNWQMVATETDSESYEQAKANVNKNNLQDFIDVRKNLTTTVIDNVLSVEEKVFAFCMCNPPFYSSVQEVYESRSTSRPPPKNGFTGSPQELITEGGELEFCKKLINESQSHKHKVLLFTTMIGHKHNLKKLLQYVLELGIKHTSTEFCQGRVTRWGLAWTYEDYDIQKLAPPRNKERKKCMPITCALPMLSNQTGIDSIFNKIKYLMETLSIKYHIINKIGSSTSCEIRALQNTWSHQRRKRRLEKVEHCKSKIQKIGFTQTEENVKKTEEENSNTTCKIHSIPVYANGNVNTTSKRLNPRCTISNKHTSNKIVQPIEHTQDDGPVLVETSKTQFETNFTSNDSYQNAIQAFNTGSTPVVHAILKILQKEGDVILTINDVGGSLGKEGIHQILQYIKNNWK